MNPVKSAHTLDLVRRARRLRRTSGIRSYVRETRLSAEQFLYPIFVTGGSGVRRVPLAQRADRHRPVAYRPGH